MLEELKGILPEVEEPFIIYFRSLKELDRVCVTGNFETEDWEQKLFDFEQIFFYLYECFDLNMTLKIHVIIHHYHWYFTKTATKLGTDHHLLKYVMQ